MPDPTQPPRLFAGLTLEELRSAARALCGPDSCAPEACQEVAFGLLEVLDEIDRIADMAARLELVRAGKGGGL